MHTHEWNLNRMTTPQKINFNQLKVVSIKINVLKLLTILRRKDVFLKSKQQYNVILSPISIKKCSYNESTNSLAKAGLAESAPLLMIRNCNNFVPSHASLIIHTREKKFL